MSQHSIWNRCRPSTPTSEDSTIPEGGEGLILLAPVEARQIIAKYDGEIFGEREALRRKAAVLYHGLHD